MNPRSVLPSHCHDWNPEGSDRPSFRVRTAAAAESVTTGSTRPLTLRTAHAGSIPAASIVVDSTSKCPLMRVFRCPIGFGGRLDDRTERALGFGGCVVETGSVY